MDKRLEATSNSENMFRKIALNGSYGYDIMNAESYTKWKTVTKSDCFSLQFSPRFISSRKINDDKFIVQMRRKSYTCKTCPQEGFFTLDNAKYWYLNFIYNFMYKCLDMNKMQFVEGDTDSMYWAISKKKFIDLIIDHEFWNNNAKYFFPSDILGCEADVKFDKKLLGLAIEKESDNMIAQCSKCYTCFNTAFGSTTAGSTVETSRICDCTCFNDDTSKGSRNAVC
jgi:hypothetical protein